MAELDNDKKPNPLDARKLASSGSIGTVSPHYGDGIWTSWVFPGLMLLLVVGLAAAAIWLLNDSLQSPVVPGNESTALALATATSTPELVPTATLTQSPPTTTPTATSTATPTPTATSTPRPTPTYTPTATSTPEPTTYTVVSGDSLGAIARAHGVELDDLLAVNDIENPSRISVGQVIIIPGPGAPVPTATATVATVATVATESTSADTTGTAETEVTATATSSPASSADSTTPTPSS